MDVALVCDTKSETFRSTFDTPYFQMKMSKKIRNAIPTEIVKSICRDATDFSVAPEKIAKLMIYEASRISNLQSLYTPPKIQPRKSRKTQTKSTEREFKYES